MDWVKLHTGYYADPKVKKLDEAAEMMFVRSLAYSGGEESGGFIPQDDVGQLTRRRRHESLVSDLVASKLWTPVDGGYQITSWDQWQDGLDELARRRAADRERQRRRRSALRDDHQSTVSRDMSRDGSRDVTPPEGELEVEVVKGGDTGTAMPSTAATPPVDNPSQNGQAPPRRCHKHADDPDPPRCGPCKDARIAAETWDRDQAAAAANQRASPRCKHHRGQPAHNCAPCRADQLATTEETR